MKQTRVLMGMPITVEVTGGTDDDIEKVFEFFSEVDARFSTYKADSEISRINRGEILPEQSSPELLEVFALAAETKRQTGGYFDILTPLGTLDPSGIVKGWAIKKAADILKNLGRDDFFIDAGGDIQTSRPINILKPWKVGIRSPFSKGEIVKIVNIKNEGVATSGHYERGAHIYNPHEPEKKLKHIVSLTVIAPNVYEADRFATAAFAMGREGINFIERMENLEGYMIDKEGMAVMTSGWERYVI
jgi:thiamine biosynthesis lipoprotein